jgi:hypothetical protein
MAGMVGETNVRICSQEELGRLGVNYKNVVEKSELVALLQQAKLRNSNLAHTQFTEERYNGKYNGTESHSALPRPSYTSATNVNSTDRDDERQSERQKLLHLLGRARAEYEQNVGGVPAPPAVQAEPTAGAVITLHGLASASHLNGRRGCLERRDGDRWIVRLDDGTVSLSLVIIRRLRQPLSAIHRHANHR